MKFTNAEIDSEGKYVKLTMGTEDGHTGEIYFVWWEGSGKFGHINMNTLDELYASVWFQA